MWGNRRIHTYIHYMYVGTCKYRRAYICSTNNRGHTPNPGPRPNAWRRPRGNTNRYINTHKLFRHPSLIQAARCKSVLNGAKWLSPPPPQSPPPPPSSPEWRDLWISQINVKRYLQIRLFLRPVTDESHEAFFHFPLGNFHLFQSASPVCGITVLAGPGTPITGQHLLFILLVSGGEGGQ